jgi:hypothetical protein
MGEDMPNKRESLNYWAKQRDKLHSIIFGAAVVIATVLILTYPYKDSIWRYCFEN